MTTSPVVPDLHILNKMFDQTKTKVFMSDYAAFLGPLMCMTEFQWTDDTATSDTDGTTIRWNPVDFIGCTPTGRVASLMHELAHIYRMHMVRIGNRDKKVWNIACDIAINRDLVEMGYDVGGWHIPGIGTYPDIPYVMEEDIYDYLMKSVAGGSSCQQLKQQGGGGDCCGGMKTNLTQQQQQQIINTVVQSAHTATITGNPGAVPGNVREIINKFLEPQIPWQKELYQFMTDALNPDTYSWRRPRRRYPDMYLPSLIKSEGRLVHIACFQDVSGSVTAGESQIFNSELKYIWETLKPEKLTIIQFDTKIQKIDVMEDGQLWADIEIHGRGGTNVECIRQYLLAEKPTAALIFSDMEFAPMRSDPKVPMLWVAIGAPGAAVPYGKVIHFPRKT